MAELKVAIDARRARQGAAEFNRSVDSMKRAAGSTTARIERGFERAWNSIMLFGSAGGAYYTIKKFVDAASDAQEIMNKFNVVFGDNALEAAAWAETFGDRVGRSTYEVQEWMASLQDTFVPLGFARDKAEELSKTLVQLGVDVGSFQNKADADVIRDFTSALVGNHETVRKYGIIISESALKQEALNEGLDKAYKELTDLEKVQLRINLLQKGSTDAMGDAERTADEYAGTIKTLHGNLDELQVLVGKQFLPEVTGAIGELNDFLKEYDSFIKRYVSDFREGVEIAQQIQAIMRQMQKPWWLLGYESYKGLRGGRGGEGEFTGGPETMGTLPGSSESELNRRLQEVYGANDKLVEDVTQTNEQIIENEEDFARRRANITALLYQDMGKFGAGYYQAHKALLDRQYSDYAKYIQDKELLDEWYYQQLDMLEQESYQKQKNALDLYIEDLEMRAGDIAGHFANAAGSIEYSLTDAFDSILSEGQSFKEAMTGFARDIGRAFSRMAAEMAAQLAMLAMMQGLGMLFRRPYTGYANPNAGVPPVLGMGGVMDKGRIMPMASGAILDRPTYFPMANGDIGLAGEAGPELGFFPLTRKNGKLSIQATANEKPVIQNEIRVKMVLVDDKRKAAIEALTTEEGEVAIIKALNNRGII